jgi:ATPase family AAA domain-containing protein 3A/B
MHCLFYGPPGTGKTLTAKKFAEYSGLEYAIMCGGDVAPLGENAVTELHNLFKWINSSRRGVVLFIDEAESFLCARHGGMSENLRNALTAMLYHTGTASSQFMLILATNRPGDLDAAVLDRVDEAIEFGLPDLDERKRMVNLYYERFGGKVPSLPAAISNKSEGVTEEMLEKIAGKIAGFSGREISKLFLALQTHAFAAGHHEINGEMLHQVVDQKVKEHDRNRHIQTHGYVYEQTSQATSQNSSVFCVVEAPERAPTVNRKIRK